MSPPVEISRQEGIILKEVQREAIANFFKASKILFDENVIRSTKYTADIAEFLCSKVLNLTLADSGRQIGFDAIDSNGRKYEIKYHGGTLRTNITIDSQEGDFTDLLIVLSPDSRLRTSSCTKDAVTIFRITDYHKKGIGNIGKAVLINQAEIVAEYDARFKRIL